MANSFAKIFGGSASSCTVRGSLARHTQSGQFICSRNSFAVVTKPIHFGFKHLKNSFINDRRRASCQAVLSPRRRTVFCYMACFSPLGDLSFRNSERVALSCSLSPSISFYSLRVGWVSKRQLSWIPLRQRPRDLLSNIKRLLGVSYPPAAGNHAFVNKLP